MNAFHVRRFSSRLTWFIDRITGRFLLRFRIGSWHCPQCNRKSVYLPLARSEVRTLELNSPPSEDNGVVSGGNFLRREKSLVARSERSTRYSQKYRESIVHKILDGHLTIAEARRELDVTESDIIHWIAASFDIQSEKIEQLTAIIQSLTSERPVQYLESIHPSDGDILDVNPAPGQAGF